MRRLRWWWRCLRYYAAALRLDLADGPDLLAMCSWCGYRRTVERWPCAELTRGDTVGCYNCPTCQQITTFWLA